MRVNACTKTRPDLERLRGNCTSMFQFQRQTPAPDSENITLEVHSRSGWFRRKVLRMGGRLIAVVSFSVRSTLISCSTRLQEVSIG